MRSKPPSSTGCMSLSIEVHVLCAHPGVSTFRERFGQLWGRRFRLPLAYLHFGSDRANCGAGAFACHWRIYISGAIGPIVGQALSPAIGVSTFRERSGQLWGRRFRLPLAYLHFGSDSGQSWGRRFRLPLAYLHFGSDSDQSWGRRFRLPTPCSTNARHADWLPGRRLPGCTPHS
jgi:hypothetical protein